MVLTQPNLHPLEHATTCLTARHHCATLMWLNSELDIAHDALSTQTVPFRRPHARMPC
jgi:hypothetical protein